MQLIGKFQFQEAVHSVLSFSLSFRNICVRFSEQILSLYTTCLFFLSSRSCLRFIRQHRWDSHYGYMLGTEIQILAFHIKQGLAIAFSWQTHWPTAIPWCSGKSWCLWACGSECVNEYTSPVLVKQGVGSQPQFPTGVAKERVS